MSGMKLLKILGFTIAPLILSAQSCFSDAEKAASESETVAALADEADDCGAADTCSDSGDLVLPDAGECTAESECDAEPESEPEPEVGDTEESIGDLETIPETTIERVEYEHSNGVHQLWLFFEGDTAAFMNDPDTSYLNVIVEMTTPEGSFVGKAFNSSDAASTSVEVDFLAVESAELGQAWDGTLERAMLLQFYELDEFEMPATSVVVDVLAGIVVDEVDVYYQSKFEWFTPENP